MKRNHLKVGVVLVCVTGLAYGAVIATNEARSKRSNLETSLAEATPIATSAAPDTDTVSISQLQPDATTQASSMIYVRGCTIISSLPFTIRASGRYCYASDLVSSSFYGVRIEANDVDLDCRGFSTATSMGRTGGTNGISVIGGSHHATIKNCKVSGFDLGITAFAGSTYGRILNNHVDSSLSIGIGAWGDFAHVTGNRVSNTHPEDSTQHATGISLYPVSPEIAAQGQVVANNVVVNTYGGSGAIGIYVSGSAAPVIRGNSIIELRPADGGFSFGLWLANWAQGANTTGARIIGNQIMSRNANFTDVFMQSGQADRCDANITIGTPSNFSNCAAGSDNRAVP